jgi:hypothetical protein
MTYKIEWDQNHVLVNFLQRKLEDDLLVGMRLPKVEKVKNDRHCFTQLRRTRCLIRRYIFISCQQSPDICIWHNKLSKEGHHKISIKQSGSQESIFQTKLSSLCCKPQQAVSATFMQISAKPGENLLHQKLCPIL